TRSLSVPDDAGFAVGAHRVDGGADCFGDSKVLVGFGDALGQAVGVFVEGGEVSRDLQETFGIEHTVDEELQAAAQMDVLEGFAERDGLAVVVDVPGRVVFQRREGRAVGGVEPIGDDGDHGEAECHGEFAQIGADLCVRGGQGRAFRAGAFEFEDGYGHAVEVDHDVETPGDFAGAQGDLVDGQKFVVFDVRADEPDSGVLFQAVGVDIADSAVAVGEHLVNAVVFGDGVLGL